MPPAYFSVTTLLHRLSQLRHRRPGHVLPFRIPFFRIFYSTTYTTLFLITLVVLAITPGTLLWTSISSEAFQYVFMIGGTYVLTALVAIFIYSSRLYTNRSVLAGVGKAYIPVEEGEVGRNVRKMVASQLERSAVIAWEARPRDAMGEVMRAEKEGGLSGEEEAECGFDREQWTVGTAIVIDPVKPPWGAVAHAGWTAPTHARGETLGNLQFATVIAELPHLIEARAVSLAPADPNAEAGFFNEEEDAVADIIVVETLRRQKTMGLREYLTQLSYLGLINPPSAGQDFLTMYEKARFCGRPSSEAEFNRLMAVFAQLLEGMTELHPDIVTEIRAQASSDESSSTLDADGVSLAITETTGSVLHFATPDPPLSRSTSSSSSARSPVTARTAFSRAVTPYMQSSGLESEESFNSVVRRPAFEDEGVATPTRRSRDNFAAANFSSHSPSLRTLDSDAGSVLHHRVSNG
jgi:hypothetical protein